MSHVGRVRGVGRFTRLGSSRLGGPSWKPIAIESTLARMSDTPGSVAEPRPRVRGPPSGRALGRPSSPPLSSQSSSTICRGGRRRLANPLNGRGGLCQWSLPSIDQAGFDSAIFRSSGGGSSKLSYWPAESTLSSLVEAQRTGHETHPVERARSGEGGCPPHASWLSRSRTHRMFAARVRRGPHSQKPKPAYGLEIVSVGADGLRARACPTGSGR
jgi:hypothetical protein